MHHDVVSHERTGLEARAALHGDERGVEHTVARHRPAPVLLVGEHPEPAELGGGSAVRNVVVRLAVGAAPHGREGMFGLHEAHRCVDEHRLLVGRCRHQVDGHGRSIDVDVSAGNGPLDRES